MSWRVILIIIVLALGAAGVSGMQLGDWLVSKAPAAAPTPHPKGPSDEVILDADGRPYTARPPQPRVDGTLGVPRTRDTDWEIPMVSLFDTVNDPAVLISRESVTPESLRALAGNDNAFAVPAPSGGSNVGTVDIMGIPETSQPIAIQPAPGTAEQSYPTQAAGGTGQGTANWQAALRNELQVCADTMGFFQRPSCAWAARRKYCEPNAGWGTIPECPERR